MRPVARTFAVISFLPLLLITPADLEAQETPTLSPTEARTQVGEEVTVCGHVFSTTQETNGDSVIRLGGPYPHQIVTVIVPSEDRSAFEEAPDQMYSEGTVCVTGTIELQQGSPTIVAHDPGVFEQQGS